MSDRVDSDPQETEEWKDAVESVIAFEGSGRADDLLEAAVGVARRNGAHVPFARNTAYVNTISTEEQPVHPGDRELERRIRSAIRWNAAMVVLKAKFLECRARGSRRRSCLYSRPLLTRDLRPLLSRRAFDRRANLELSPRRCRIIGNSQRSRWASAH